MRRAEMEGGNMADIRLIVLIGVLSLSFISIGCDKLKDLASSKFSAPAKTQEKQLSIESILDGVTTKSQQDVAQAHKEGQTKVVGLLDGKTWLENPNCRVAYIRGIADLASSLKDINSIVWSGEVNETDMVKEVKIISEIPPSFYIASLHAESNLSERFNTVLAGRTFGDISNAVTKFYEDKPLMKDKPVIWVLAIPLYQQLQESLPKEKRRKDDITIPVKPTK